MEKYIYILERFKKFYFVGIGGIGMSASAYCLKKSGKTVFGCDSNLEEKTIDILKEIDIEIFDEKYFDLSAEKNRPDCFVITNTIKENHAVYVYSKNYNIPIFKRSEILSYILKDKNIIGVTGSHGKTSTSAFISHILMENKFDPSIFIGGIMNSIHKNVQIGNGKFSVVEADDAYKSFLDLNPFISIITTISLEHLETYKDIDDIKNTFIKYANQTSDLVVLNIDDENIISIKNKIKTKSITYGIKSNADYYAKNILIGPLESEYDLYKYGNFLHKIIVPIPGIHQVKNSLAAAAVSDFLNIKIDKISKSIKSHLGVERRFQKIGEFCGASVYDDYAHHPNEIKNMLQVIKSLTPEDSKKYVFFQPHKYTRTKALWNDFIKVFSEIKIDGLFITDIFSAGDNYDETYNSKNLTTALKKNGASWTEYIEIDKDFFYLNEKIKFLKKTIKKNDIIFCMGAGKLDKFAKLLTNKNFNLKFK
jgi:UDP-N-acetylmuramate--alanine ligase